MTNSNRTARSFRRLSTVAVGALSAALMTAGPALADPALWVVKDTDSTIYLFGTVHLLRKDMVWNTPALKRALADSTELWVEIDEIDDPAVMAPLVQKYGLDLQRPLSSKLSAAQNAKLAIAAGKVGMTAAQLEPFKPWFAGLTLTVLALKASGFDENAGVDKLLLTAAKAEGDQIRAFETVEEQLRFFDDLPEAQQVAFLDQMLDDVEGGTAVLDTLAGAWAKGDVETIGDILIDEMQAEAPELYDIILPQRNARWADRIETMLKGSGTQFIAVGAGHLAGPDSVQRKLEAKGIRAERR